MNKLHEQHQGLTCKAFTTLLGRQIAGSHSFVRQRRAADKFTILQMLSARPTIDPTGDAA